jgi:PAS domain S-box-containing protein
MGGGTLPNTKWNCVGTRIDRVALSHRSKLFLLGIAAIAIAAIVFLAGEWISRHRIDALSRATLKTELEGLAQSLQGEIEKSVDLGRGFAAAIAAHKGIAEEEFSAGCDSLLRREPKIRNIALIVGSIITYNCPAPENSATIGIDLRQRPDQWPSFERMRETGKPDVAGPVNLVQGGWSIVVRVPIFIRGEGGRPPVFWGALSMPLRMEGLFAQSGIADAAQIVNLAIRGNRNATLAPEFLLGDPTVFDDTPVAVEVPFPDGAWKLAARVPTFGAKMAADTTLHLATLVAALLSGLLFFVVAVYADRRRRLEEVANRNRDMLYAFMENAPVAMYVKDMEGGYIDLNAEARRAFKIGDKEYAGHKLDEFFNERIAVELRAEDARACAGEVVRTERNSSQGQAYPWEREIKFPVLDNEGKVIAIGGYVIDITAAKEAEIRLVRALQAAEEANRAKSEFLATMSHELRTPLNAIIGFSDVIRREIFGAIDNQTYKGYIENIHASGEQLADLLGGIIDLSAVESGRIEVKREAVKAADVLGDCRAIVEVMAHERRHELHIVDAAGGACLADRRLLRQVLLNLASNAAKYTRKGGVIEIATRDDDAALTFCVTDNGVGMTEQEIERAMQPFTRLGDTMRAEVGGSGIGLALVKRLVEAMGGRLHIASKPGTGTRVEVSMPKAEAPETIRAS